MDLRTRTTTKAVQQINFSGDLERGGNTKMFFILEEKRNYFGFFTGNCQTIVNIFCFNIISI